MLCPSQCAACPANQESLFSKLDSKSLSLIEQSKMIRTMKPKEILFSQGQASDHLYCIGQGMVKLYKTDAQGHRKIIQLAGPGEMIGYRSMLANVPYQATAQSMQEGKICIISKKAFQEAIGHSKDFAMALLSHLAKNLGQAQNNELDLAHKHIDQRFAQLLLFLKDKYGVVEPQGIRLDVSLSRQDIADLIGATQESAIRIVTTFKRLGILATDKKRMMIIDAPKLEQLMEEVELG
jgi:CRP/FNR family transcriptional regulator